MSKEKCFICKEPVGEFSCFSSNPKDVTINLQYKGGNGKTRVYHRNCVINAVEVFMEGKNKKPTE